MWVRRALFALALCTTLLGACASGPRTPVTEESPELSFPIGPRVNYAGAGVCGGLLQEPQAPQSL
jgi:hypothetical protein